MSAGFLLMLLLRVFDILHVHAHVTRGHYVVVAVIPYSKCTVNTSLNGVTFFAKPVKVRFVVKYANPRNSVLTGHFSYKSGIYGGRNISIITS